MNRIQRKIYYFITQTVYKWRFCHIGKRTVIVSPLQLDNVKSISLENDVLISDGAWLMGSNELSETLRIGEHTTIGHLFHIVAINNIIIGKNVLIADRVFISDCTHGFEDITVPIKVQEVLVIGKVSIGDDTWIGENVCVCGHSIGKHCIIGANSVVNKDIPDFTVAAGNPIRLIKKYDIETNTWRRI